MKNQQGAVLIVGLVVLLVMTLIGVTSLSTTTSQLKMANNLQTQQWAFQGTEAVGSFFKDGMDKDANPMGVVWNTRVAQSFSNLDPAGQGQSLTTLDAIYVDCTTLVIDQGLTGDSQSGEGGGPKYGVIRDLQITSTAVNSASDPIGQNNSRVNGVLTLFPGCP